MAKYDYVIPDHEIEIGVMLKVSTLKVDAQAQRALVKGRVEKMAEDYQPAGIGTIEVSRRKDGGTYVIDGQHRVKLCEIVGEEEIPANVHIGLDRQAEAMLFLLLNQESLRPTAIDEYRIGLAARLPLFVDIDKVLLAHGLGVGSGSSTNRIAAIANVRDAVKRHGPVALDRALTIAEGAWGRQAETWEGMLLGGLTAFVGKHGDDPAYLTGGGDASLETRLARKGWSWAMRETMNESTAQGTRHSGGSGRPAAAYRVFVGAWNTRRKESARLVAA